ncbi:MAG: hypothetical protein AAGH89_18705 [Verrucomicrobiota bacterium]
MSEPEMEGPWRQMAKEALEEHRRGETLPFGDEMELPAGTAITARQAYVPKPLVWEKKRGNVLYWSASPGVSVSYWVCERHVIDWGNNWNGCLGESPSLEAAKAAAEAHWRERLMECLEVVE